MPKEEWATLGKLQQDSPHAHNSMLRFHCHLQVSCKDSPFSLKTAQGIPGCRKPSQSRRRRQRAGAGENPQASTKHRFCWKVSEEKYWKHIPLWERCPYLLLATLVWCSLREGTEQKEAISKMLAWEMLHQSTLHQRGCETLKQGRYRPELSPCGRVNEYRRRNAVFEGTEKAK